MADTAAARSTLAPPNADTNPAAKSANTRRRLFTILGAVLVVGAVLAFLYWALIARNHVSTDDAYVGADSADVTPLVSEPVTVVNVVDTQPVKQGQILVQLDDTDAKIEVAQAQAQLGQAMRKVQGYFANENALQGQISARQADIQRADAQIASAQSDLDRARTELQRREKLASSGAVSGDELTQAQNAFHTAEAALSEAKASRTQAEANLTAAGGNRAVNTALIQGVDVGHNPEVAAAQAKLDQAQLDLDRTVLRAPLDGVVAKKNVSVGQRVQIGSTLMTIVPITQSYVDANFKEVQLRKVRIGQPVTLTSDFYGSGVKFHGTVIGMGGGTGSAFALIPAQNATGNWIKIVQRLPVRVAVNPDDMKAHPLRVGLSMSVDIDIAQH